MPSKEIPGAKVERTPLSSLEKLIKSPQQPSFHALVPVDPLSLQAWGELDLGILWPWPQVLELLQKSP